jgi:hypothetical protein
MTGYQKKKTESLSGVVAGRVTYRGGEEGGKQSFIALAIFIDKNGKNEIRKLKAFGFLADSLAHLSDGDKLTASTYKNSSGEDIIDAFREGSQEVQKTVRKEFKVTKEWLKAKNEGLAREGLALVRIKLPDKESLSIKSLSQTLVLDGEVTCKLEYIMDVLGASYVNEVLKKNGLLGDTIPLGEGKKFANRYNEVKGALYKLAIGMTA